MQREAFGITGKMRKIRERENAAWSAKRKDSGGVRMTRGVIGRIVLGVWLGCVTAAAQLPPEVLVDKYLRQAERLVQENNHDGARTAMKEMLALQQEHGLEPAPEDHFRYAQVWSATGAPQLAIESLIRYLQLRGREAEHYGEALDLMNKAESEKERREAESDTPAKQADRAPSTGTPAKASGRANVRQPLESSVGARDSGVDYAKCAEFFNMSEGNIVRTGAYTPDRLRFIPFNLLKDGSIAVHEEKVISRETRKRQGGTVTIITYRSPSMRYLESLNFRSVSNYPNEDKHETVKVVIRRDEGGNLSEILEELPRNFAPGAHQNVYSSIWGNRTTFEIKNGQCVPMRVSQLLIRRDGEKAELGNHHTGLCRDLFEFHEKNPQVAYALKKEINQEVTAIFDLHRDNISKPKRFFSFERHGYNVISPKYLHSEKEFSRILENIWDSKDKKNDLETKMSLSHHAHKKLSPLEQKRRRVMPIYFSVSIAADCDRNRLGPFIRDDSLWTEDEDAKGTSGEKDQSPTAGQESTGNTGSGTTTASNGPSAHTSAIVGGGPCQVPGYPNPPGGVASLGFSWCPASVSMQVRAFALQAAGAQCAIATGSSSTPEQIEARRREIRAACSRLAALGQGNCQCPAGLGQ